MALTRRQKLAQQLRATRDAQAGKRSPRGEKNAIGTGSASTPRGQGDYRNVVAHEQTRAGGNAGGVGGVSPAEKNVVASGHTSALRQAGAGTIDTKNAKATGTQVTGGGAPGIGGNSVAGSGPQTGLGQNYQPGFGQQLSSRVSSGAIDQGRAKQTASERALLEQAYGANWRHHVYGDRGYMKRTREALAQNPNDPQVKALYAQLVRSRSEALARAKEKLGKS